MITIGAFIVLLVVLWFIKKILDKLLSAFRLDFKERKEELLKEYSKPSPFQFFSASIQAFFFTVLRSPGNLILVLIWAALSIAMVLILNEFLAMMGLVKDVFEFFIAGGR